MAREAAARSIAASQLLPWTSLPSVRNSSNKGWAVLSVRVWLVALKLMQDDDEEIRNIISLAVAAASGPEEEGSSVSALGVSIPPNFALVQGCVFERMGGHIAQCVVWSVNVSRYAPGASRHYYTGTLSLFVILILSFLISVLVYFILVSSL